MNKTSEHVTWWKKKILIPIPGRVEQRRHHKKSRSKNRVPPFALKHSVLEGQLLSKNSRMKFSQSFLFVIYFPHTSIHWSQLRFLSLLFIFSHLLFIDLYRGIPYGLAVRIPGFHPGGLGSSPGMGTHFLSVQTLQVLLSIFIKHWALSWIYQSEIFFFKQLYYENFLTRYEFA